MKLRDYIAKLQKINITHGGDLEVIYAIDDEGNDFHRVYYNPSPGLFDGNEFANVTTSQPEANSVCVN